MGTQIQKHKDGSLWSKGQMINGKMDGYWEWFRRDGSKLRSGYFKMDRQVGQWITYDKSGQPHKVTDYDKKKSGEK